jgi:hypothetical protein
MSTTVELHAAQVPAQSAVAVHRAPTDSLRARDCQLVVRWEQKEDTL